MPAGKRARHYQVDDGYAPTVALLAGKLVPFARRLVDMHTKVYESNDMKVGVDVPQLEKIAQIMYALVSVDQRGGIFSQGMLSEAVESAIVSEGLGGLLDAQSLPSGKPRSEVLALMTYKLRVALSHLRAKFDARTKECPGPPALQPCFELMASVPQVS